MNTLEFDILIIGSGVAGLVCASELAEKGLKIGIVTREHDPQISNTLWAQGGTIFPHEGEVHKDLVEDIQKASSYTSNVEAAKILEEQSGKILKEVLIDKVKTDFERDELGLCFTKEAAHSFPRILFKGDYTGREIQISLLNHLKDQSRFPSITFLQGHTAIDLITPLHHGVHLQQRYEENKVLGAYLFNRTQEVVIKVLAKTTVLATGGVGALYLHHSNAEGARGDGHAMARRAGAVLTNMEFIQFHPTTFFDSSSHRRFLISEALRGEGGVLINSEGNAFMESYHPDRELAPRDVVSRSIDEEMIKTRHDCCYLDISFKDSTWIKERFPTIYEHCLKKNVDITSEPIPVVPAAHYTCGGVKTDLDGKTSLTNLYAVGEVACTGLHGANRLASTSLAEGVTWGYLAAQSIMKNVDILKNYPSENIRDWQDGSVVADPALIQQDWLTLKQTMWNYVGLTRTSNRLKRGEAMFRELYEEIQRFYRNAYLQDELIGLRNGVEVASQVLSASMRNRQSVGCFYRLD
ncbi:MAG: FAD-binding protein [Bacteriovoracaceae bacterium]|nr:FAD-binding protein [Bacteriovoracaceae bacterium]